MKLKVESVVDVLYRDVRHRILVGEERPGAVLTEMSLGQHYDVARPTAKAAIERLVADGLVVRTRRGAGATVREITVEDVQDLYATRILVESAAHERLAASDVVLDEAVLANRELRDAAEANDALTVVASDVRFHRALVSQLGQPRFSRLHDQLLGEVHLCMAQVQELQLLSADVIADEHDGILAAIRHHQSADARMRTASHLDRARQHLIDHLNAAPGPSTSA